MNSTSLSILQGDYESVPNPSALHPGTFSTGRLSSRDSASGGRSYLASTSSEAMQPTTTEARHCNRYIIAFQVYTTYATHFVLLI